MKNDIWRIILMQHLVQCARYFIVAGIAYIIFYLVFKNKWLDKKIQKRFPDSQQIKREIKDSLVSLLIFTWVAVLIIMATRAGYTRIYKDVYAMGKWYFWLSIPLFILWHDTWFYWTHRLMHHRALFGVIHKQHHLSHNPTPWTAFAFHPLEAFIETGFVMIVFFVPLHPFCLLIGVTWQMLFNVYGHLGFEFISSKMYHSWWGRVFNTSTHHNMHHRLTKGNYGLYFNFWDRIMHTNHPEYDNQFDKKLPGQANIE